MGQPVKISDELLLDARTTASFANRSIAGQIEYWAQLGRALDPLLEGAQALALQKSGRSKPLSAALKEVDSPVGRRRVAEYLQTTPFPHYRAAPGKRGMLLRIDEDGKRTLGRFVGRKFKASR
jgi:hypothetical protein